jgi:PQQ-dependent catabolism-associated CXXCW motif protein
MKTASQSPARAAKATRRPATTSRTAARRRRAALFAFIVAALAPLPYPVAAPHAAEGAAPAPAQSPAPQSGAAHPDTVAPAASTAKPSGPVAEPAGYRMEDFRTPVPATLKGARVLTADEAADLWNKNGALFIDVYPQAPKPPNLPAGTFWREPAHRSIEGAQWLPNVGYGALSATMEEYFRARLEALSKGKHDAPLIFFCLKDCWMSWNAAKRALEYGYGNIMWFRDGTDGWQELGYPLVDVKKLP